MCSITYDIILVQFWINNSFSQHVHCLWFDKEMHFDLHQEINIPNFYLFRSSMYSLVPHLCSRVPAIILVLLWANRAAPVYRVAPLVLLCSQCRYSTILFWSHGWWYLWDTGCTERVHENGSIATKAWKGNAVGRDQLLCTNHTVPTQLSTGQCTQAIIQYVLNAMNQMVYCLYV